LDYLTTHDSLNVRSRLFKTKIDPSRHHQDQSINVSRKSRTRENLMKFSNTNFKINNIYSMADSLRPDGDGAA
jgi:hypothetical protein